MRIDGHAVNFTTFRFIEEDANSNDPPDGQPNIVEAHLIQFPTRIQPAFGQMRDSLDAAAKKAKENSGKAVRIEALDWTLDSLVMSGLVRHSFDFKALGWLPVSNIEEAKEALAILYERQKHTPGYDASDAQQSYEKGIARLQYVHDNSSVYSNEIPGSLCCGGETDISLGVAIGEEPSTALVVKSAVANHVDFSIKAGQEMLYPFGRNAWKVPAEKMEHYPTKRNVISASDLSSLRENRTSAVWKPFLHPVTLGRMRGNSGPDPTDVDGGTNLWTTFHVIDEDGNVMPSMSDKIFVPNQDIIIPILKEYADESSSGNSSIDLESDEGKAITKHIFGWLDTSLSQKKMDVKHNGGSVWTKTTGTYVSPLPKILKAPRQSKSAANDGANGGSSSGKKRALLQAASSAQESEYDPSKVYVQSIVGGGPIECSFVLKVGSRYSIASADMCPPGYIIVHRYRDEDEDEA